MPLDLTKKVDLVKAITAQRNFPATKVAVKAATDISLSMQHLFKNGTVQEVTDRMLAVAVRFDDNQSIESYAYGSAAVRLADVTPADFGNYINTKFLPEAERSGQLWSGTDFGAAFKRIAKDCKGGFFKKAGPSYLMFGTDGQTYDKVDAEKQLQVLGENNVYVQLIGIGRDDFGFLKDMADKYDFVGFVHLPNIEGMTDEQLYDQLLTDELATWLRRF